MRATGQTRNLKVHSRERGQGGRRAGDPGRMAGRFGRRLAVRAGIWPGKSHSGSGGRRTIPNTESAGAVCCQQHRLLGLRRRPLIIAGLGTPIFAEALAGTLLLIHGGIAQNVGPILEMVTAKYLLRGKEEWEARRAAQDIFRGILARRQERRSGLGRQHNPELGRSVEGDHSLGHQPVYRDDHPRGAGRAGRRLLGFPDARRDVRRRYGLLRRAATADEFQDQIAAIMDALQV